MASLHLPDISEMSAQTAVIASATEAAALELDHCTIGAATVAAGDPQGRPCGINRAFSHRHAWFSSRGMPGALDRDALSSDAPQVGTLATRVTSPAKPSAGRGNFVAGPGMTALTRRVASQNLTCTSVVLRLRDRLKMRRLTTQARAAQVVDMEARGDRPVRSLICQSVNERSPMLTVPTPSDQAIAARRLGASPEQTPGLASLAAADVALPHTANGSRICPTAA